MPIHLTPGIDILGAIKQLDQLLTKMNIVPVLEYRKIRYKLQQADEPFMTIALSTNSITYEKLYLPESEAVHSVAYKRIEAFIHSFSAISGTMNAV